MILNGIHNFVQESDLASRCITVTLQPLDYGTRRDETELSLAIQEQLPNIFRGVLNLAAKILQAEPQAKVINPERLMNFSRWLAAMETVLKLPQGNLQKAYSDNLRQASLDNVQENVVAVTLLRFMEKTINGHWQGTATKLLEELSKIAPANTVQRQSEWPQNAISMSKRLKQLEALVEPQGITIDFSHGTQRTIDIRYLGRNITKPIDGSDGPDDESCGIPQEAQDAASNAIETDVVQASPAEPPKTIQIEVIQKSKTEPLESESDVQHVQQVVSVPDKSDEGPPSSEEEPASNLESDPSLAVEAAAADPESESDLASGSDTRRDLENPDMGGSANG